MSTPGSPTSTGRRRLFAAVLFLVPLLAFEAASRAVWSWGGGLGYFDPLEYRYYPELREVREAPPKAPGGLDVLLLGGSVLERAWGNAAGRLERKLSRATGRPVRVHNVARASHSTLDSLYKYRHLSSRHFDLVFVYHAINELRANSCPPEVFRDDYSHYHWYATVNAFERHPETWLVTTPWTADFLAREIAQRIRPEPRVAKEPGGPWLSYGNNIKTATPFGRNLEAILDLAARKGEPVMLSTFAWYIPDGYDRGRFEERDLDYGFGVGSYPVEFWGRPPNVARGLAVHNDIVRALARRRRTLFVDLEASMPRDGKHFRDVCHLMPEGGDHLAAEVVRALAGKPERLQN